MANDIDPILEKKLSRLDSYGNGGEYYNLVGGGELTVRITLAEYRDLVTKVATRETAIDQANKDKYQRDQEIKKVTDENAELKAELYELKKRLDEYNSGGNEDG